MPPISTKGLGVFLKTPIAICLMLVAGCGTAPPKSESAQNNSESTPPTTQQQTTQQQTTPDETTAEVTEITELAVGSPIQQAGETPSTRSSNNTSNNTSDDSGNHSTTSAASATPNDSPKVFEPTAEQLDRWQLIEFEPWQLLARQATNALSFVSCAASTADGNWLVLGGDKLTLWKMGSQAPSAVLWESTNAPENRSISSLAIAPNNQWFATGDSTGVLTTWNLTTHAEIATKKIYGTGIVQIAISDDGQEVATTTYQNEVSIWNAKSLEPKNKFAANGYTKLCYVAPDQLIVAGQSMEIWQASTGKMMRTILDGGYVQSVARSKDRAWYAIASDKELQLNHVNDSTQSKRVQGEFATNELLEFSSDGKQLWSANETTVRAWDLERGTMQQVIDTFGPSIVGINYLPSEQLLRLVTEDGTIKLWGTAVAGQTHGLKPLHSPVLLPAPNSPQLATAAQLLEAIDTRSLPRPPHSQATMGDSSMTMFETSEPIDEVKNFYRYLLHKKGWIEQPGNPNTPDYLNFAKDNFRLFASLYASQPSVTAVQLSHLGNSKADSIPKLDKAEAKIIYEDNSSATYQIKMDLLTAEIELLKKLHAAGWIPYSRLNASHSAEKESRDLEFIQNAITLRVSARPTRDDPASLLVQYTTFVAQSNLPVPKDCDYIECDANQSPALVAFTSLNLEECTRFYDQTMPTYDWLPADVSSTDEKTSETYKDTRWLTYFRGQQEITFRLSSQKDGRTCICTGEHAEQNSWQLTTAESTDTEDIPKESESMPGIEAADLPIYKSAEANKLNYETRFKQIEVEIPKTSHIEIVDYYAKTLGDQGWKEETGGFRAEDYAFVTFTKEDRSVELRVNSSESLNTTTYSLSDDGILWSKPLPEREELVSYETWLRKHHHPATLQLLDSFLKEMQNISSAQ